MRETNRLMMERSLIEDSSEAIDNPEEETPIRISRLENLAEIDRWLWRMLGRRLDSVASSHALLVNRCIHGHLIVGVRRDEGSITVEHIEIHGRTIQLLIDLTGTHRMVLQGLNGSDLIRKCGGRDDGK